MRSRGRGVKQEEKEEPKEKGIEKGEKVEGCRGRAGDKNKRLMYILEVLRRCLMKHVLELDFVDF